MTSVTAYLPGLIPPIDPSRPPSHVQHGKSFAGLLEPHMSSIAGGDSAVARSFDEGDLFGHATEGHAGDAFAQKKRHGQAATLPPFAREAAIPGPLMVCSADRDISKDGGSASLPIDQRMLMHAKEQQARSEQRPLPAQTPMPSVSAFSPNQEPVSRTFAPGSAAGVLRFLKMQAIRRAAPVSVSVSMQTGGVEIIVRGDVPLAELKARLKTTLAEFDLDLASLRLNGIDQSFASHHPVGEKHGNR